MTQLRFEVQLKILPNYGFKQKQKQALMHIKEYSSTLRAMSLKLIMDTKNEQNKIIENNNLNHSKTLEPEPTEMETEQPTQVDIEVEDQYHTG